MSARTIVLLAHNIRSLWNVGSFFRSSDAFGVSHVHLTGYTALPPRMEIAKTALGAETWISWSHDQDPLDVIAKRKKDGYVIVSLERNDTSTPIEAYKWPDKVCIVLGHEVSGVPDIILQLSDAVVHIPMLGRKNSLNVSVAAGVALAAARSHSRVA